MLKELNPELFIWELWEPGFWDSLDLTYTESMDIDNLVEAIKKYGVGYCNSTRLQVRPKDENYLAVMCEKDGRKFWFHVFKDDLLEIL